MPKVASKWIADPGGRSAMCNKTNARCDYKWIDLFLFTFLEVEEIEGFNVDLGAGFNCRVVVGISEGSYQYLGRLGLSLNADGCANTTFGRRCEGKLSKMGLSLL